MPPRRRKMPAIPATVPSALGPLPVVEESPNGHPTDPLKEDFGVSRFDERTIGLKTGMAPEAAWQTLGHELGHFILFDGGAHDSLSHKQRELVCNAIGTFVAAAVQSGALKFVQSKRD